MYGASPRLVMFTQINFLIIFSEVIYILRYGIIYLQDYEHVIISKVRLHEANRIRQHEYIQKKDILTRYKILNNSLGKSIVWCKLFQIIKW